MMTIPNMPFLLWHGRLVQEEEERQTKKKYKNKSKIKKRIRSKRRRRKSEEKKNKEKKNKREETSQPSSTDLQVFQTKNFKIFVAMNFLQVFDVTVSSNFFAIYERSLLGHDAWPQIARTMIVGASFILPQVFAFSMTPWVAKIGSYNVIMCVCLCFVVVIAIGILLFGRW